MKVEELKDSKSEKECLEARHKIHDDIIEQLNQMRALTVTMYQLIVWSELDHSKDRIDMVHINGYESLDYSIDSICQSMKDCIERISDGSDKWGENWREMLLAQQRIQAKMKT